MSEPITHMDMDNYIILLHIWCVLCPLI